MVTLSNEGALYIASEIRNLIAINTSGDYDLDGLPQWWEKKFGLDDTNRNDAQLDNDNDGLTNIQEFAHSSNPSNADSDGDGLSDAEEITHGSNPIVVDSDGDGLIDGEEVNTYATNPLLIDSDNDGFSDGIEVHDYLTNPLDASSVPVTISSMNESFESGVIPTGWVRGAVSQTDWSIDASMSNSGQYSLRSGNIGLLQTSAIKFSISVPAGTLSYYAKSSNWIDYRHTLFVDGVPNFLSAANTWRLNQISLSAGKHTLEWRNYNDFASTPIVTDALWIDDITFVAE